MSDTTADPVPTLRQFVRLHAAVFTTSLIVITAAMTTDIVATLRRQVLSHGYRVDVAIVVALTLAVTGSVIGWRVRRDLREEVRCRVDAEEAALTLSNHDPLTGAFNRRVLDDRLHRALAPGCVRSVIVVDIDDFKAINDLRGHATGDVVLRAVAQRLQSIVPVATGSVIRLGGDEFTIVADLVATTNGQRLAEQVADVITQPIQVKVGTLRISASVGQAAGDERELAQLLRRADADMYRAKEARALTDREAYGNDATSAGRHHAPSPERRRFLDQALRSVDHGENQVPVFVAMIGVDRLAGIRLVVGNDFCNILVRDIADRIGRFDHSASVARWSGDTIGVRFQAEDLAAARAWTERLRSALLDDIVIDGHPVNVTVTVGLAGPGCGKDLRQLTDGAQIALDRAHHNRCRFVLADAADAAAPNSLSLLQDLKIGMRTGQFSVAYQPKMLAATGMIDSMEALIRWVHPAHGNISPDRFITLAEQTGDIGEITRWVMNRVVQEQDSLTARGHVYPIYVNLSARLLSDDAFIAETIALLRGRSPAIGLEITETAVLEDPDTAIRHVRALKDAGISIAIDDYGAGMSSLSYLKQLPADELKIDRMFVSDLTNDHRDPLLVRSTIDLAHGLGMRVTAEGVDAPATIALLKAMGCDLLQGYIIARPLALDALVSFLEGPTAAVGLSLTAGSFSSDAYWNAAGQTVEKRNLAA